MPSAIARNSRITNQTIRETGAEQSRSSQSITRKPPYSQKRAEPNLDGASSKLDDVAFLRLPEVKAITGLSKSSLYALIREKSFPAPVRLDRVQLRGSDPRSGSGLQSASGVAVCGLMPPRVLTSNAFARFAGLVEEISPALHHDTPLRKVKSLVIGGLHIILRSMSKLHFDVRAFVSHLVQDRGCQAAKAMAGHLSLVAHPLYGTEHRVLVHVRAASFAGKQPDIILSTFP